MTPEFLSEFLPAHCLSAGPLRGHLEVFAAQLADRGYAESTSRERIRLVANLGRWLGRRQLQLVDYFAPPNANWMWRRDLDMNVTPVVVDYRGRKFLVGTSKECRMWLLDRDSLGGDDHRTSLQTTPLLCNDAQAYDATGVWGALAAWQDATGAQWIVVPFWGPVSQTFKAPIEHGRPVNGGVAAYKLEERAGRWQLVPAWLSRDVYMAENAIVANGIVFTYGSGEDTTQTVLDRAWDAPGGGRMGGGLDSSAARRIPNSTTAAIYALDALTGRELWSSGNEIRSWNHFSGITVANGRVYLTTFDGTLYAFGVPRPGQTVLNRSRRVPIQVGG